MVRTLLAALVVAYLPGALIFRVPVFGRPDRAKVSADERGFWALMLSAAWSLLVVLGLAGVGAYSFERLLLVNLTAAAIVLAVWRRRLLYRGDAPRVSWPALVPMLIVAIGIFVFFPSAEYVIGGKDPGTYVNEGIQIAQSGRLIIKDPVVAAIPPEFRDLFFPDHQHPDYYSLRFMGFWIQNPQDGSVIGQFPHLLAASIAIGYSLDGIRGALGTVGVWAILGLLAVYFAGARLFGRAAAFGAVVLLAANVIEIWFARYPNSELAMQALLFAAVLAFARALDGSQTFFGTVAGGLLGLMVFLRYEVLLAFAAFGIAATLAPVMRRRIGRAFGVTLALTGLAGFWYLQVPMRAYSGYPLGFTRHHGGWWLAAGGLASVWIVRRLLRREALMAAVRQGVPATLALVIVVLAVYAYFFRPAGNGITEYDAHAFRTFGWYVTPWVLGAAVAAFAILVTLRFWHDPAFFLTFAGFGLFFFYKTRIVPEHFWITRRFLAVALPGSLLLVAALVHEIVGGGRLAALLGRLRGTAPAAAASAWIHAAGVVLLSAVLIPIGVTFWRASDPVHRHVEYKGLRRHIEDLAALIGDRDLLIVEGRNAMSDVHTFALPLAYIYQRHVLVLDTAVPPRPQMEAFVTWARSSYGEVYFLGGGGTALLSRHLTADPIVSDQFTVPEYDAPKEAYPTGVRQKEFEFGLYRLVPTSGLPSGPIDLAIGTRDDLYTVRFHSKEGRPGASLVFRWTRGLSYVVLLGIADTAREVTLWMSNGNRPDSAPAPTVEVALEDRVLGSRTVGNGLAPYTFAIPADLAARAAASPDPMLLSLRVPTWNPVETGSGPDRRDLGVQVSRVQVQ